MPTYQYACTGCDERIEVVQRFTDDPLTECSVCGSRLRKIFSPVGIVFKGSGFYRTDSRAPARDGANGYGNGQQKDKDSAASGESTSAGEAKTSGESTSAGKSGSGSSDSSDSSGSSREGSGSSSSRDRSGSSGAKKGERTGKVA